MRKKWLTFLFATALFLSLNTITALAYDDNVIHTVGERAYRSMVIGQVYADNHTDAYLLPRIYGPDSSDSNRPDVILFRGEITVRSAGNSMIVQAFQGEIVAIIRVRGTVRISDGWGGLEIKPLQGDAELLNPNYVLASVWNKTFIRISAYGKISCETYYWNNYSSFENWCLSYNSGQYGESYQYQDSIEDRGQDDDGNYVVVRTYDPEVRICYSVTYYYVSDPWWWYRTEYGRFEYVPGYGWVFIPYPVFWHRHCYYHEAPPNRHYYHGIIIKEREENSPHQQIPKENIVPYRPRATPDENDPSKYKVRRVHPDNPPNRNNPNQPPNQGGNQVVPREHGSSQQPGAEEPKRREPNNPPNNSPNGNGNGQVRPKEPQNGHGQSKPPEKQKEPPKKEPKNNPDPPKKEKT